MFFRMYFMIAAVLLCFVSPQLIAESAQLIMIKDQILELEQRGETVPSDLYETEKQLQALESNLDKSGANKPENLSCTQNLIGAWTSSNKSKTIVLNTNGLGYFIQQSFTDESSELRADFTWKSSQESITFNYTSDLISNNLETGMQKHKGKLDSGAVSCNFAGTVLIIDGVPYYP